jgi:hypothetical protein
MLSLLIIYKKQWLSERLLLGPKTGAPSFKGPQNLEKNAIFLKKKLMFKKISLKKFRGHYRFP